MNSRLGAGADHGGQDVEVDADFGNFELPVLLIPELRATRV